MNNFLQENLYSIILFLMLIILLLIALIGVVLVKILLSPKNNQPMATPPVLNKKEALIPIIESSSAKLKKLAEEIVVEKFFCENHPDSPSVGGCLICEDVFCERCLIEHEGLYFCREHFRTFANNKWKQITDLRTTPDTPDDGLFIYHFKRHIWKEHQTPTFVLTHYKINIEEDYIESFIQLNVREAEAERLNSEIEKFKAKL